MTLRTRIFLPFAAAVVLVVGVFGYAILSHMKVHIIKRAQDVAVAHMKEKAGEYLTPENFEDADPSRQAGAFEKLMAGVMTPEILKLKAFNDKGTIIYSTAWEHIGQKASGSNYFRALQGEVVAEIKPPVRGEYDNIDMRQYRQVMEIYVPVTYANRVYGVIELYYKMDFMNDVLRAVTRGVVSLGIIAVAVILTVAYLLVKQIPPGPRSA